MEHKLEIKLEDYITLDEIKEEPVSKDLEEAISQSFIYHENHGDDFRSDKQLRRTMRIHQQLQKAHGAMIYVGYQGIGKSTLAHKIPNVIDLESGNFFVGGYRHEDWFMTYANIAHHLSNQGKIVFTSSHKVLREYMERVGIPFTVVYPALELKEQWIAKLKQRFEETKRDKDFKAWVNAKEKYKDNIKDLSKERSKVVITNMDYSLENLIL